jgi:hypothetical protein
MQLKRGKIIDRAQSQTQVIQHVAFYFTDWVMQTQNNGQGWIKRRTSQAAAGGADL